MNRKLTMYRSKRTQTKILQFLILLSITIFATFQIDLSILNGSSTACFYPWFNECGLRKFVSSHAFGDDGGIFVASVFG